MEKNIIKAEDEKAEYRIQKIEDRRKPKTLNHEIRNPNF